jgi:hypothetical protein
MDWSQPDKKGLFSHASSANLAGYDKKMPSTSFLISVA